MDPAKCDDWSAKVQAQFHDPSQISMSELHLSPKIPNQPRFETVDLLFRWEFWQLHIDVLLQNVHAISILRPDSRKDQSPKFNFLVDSQMVKQLIHCWTAAWTKTL